MAKRRQTFQRAARKRKAAQHARAAAKQQEQEQEQETREPAKKAPARKTTGSS